MKIKLPTSSDAHRDAAILTVNEKYDPYKDAKYSKVMSKYKLITTLGILYIIFGILFLVNGVVPYIQTEGQYFLCENTWFCIPYILTGSIGVAASRIQRRTPMIVFFSLASLSIFVSVVPIAKSGKLLLKEYSYAAKLQHSDIQPIAGIGEHVKVGLNDIEVVTIASSILAIVIGLCGSAISIISVVISKTLINVSRK